MAHAGRLLLVSLSFIAGAVAVAACSSGDPSAPDLTKEMPPDPPASSSGGSGSGSAPTFHKDVEPILQNHCQKCHTPGGLAPFALMTFADAHGLAPALVAETEARRMPPWGAQDTTECKPRLPWDHDERLTAVEIKTLADWSAAGAPEGDPKSAPPPRAIPKLELKGVTDTLVPKAPFTASGDRDQFRCFVLDHPYQAGVYITGIHVLPGNAKVVHHAVVFTDPTGAAAARAGADGSFDCSSAAMMNAGVGGGPMNGSDSITLDVWTPGITPVDLPSNIAIPLTPNSKLIMQIHYSPGGKTAEPDTTKVQLRTTYTKPEYFLFTSAVGNAAAQVATTGDGLLPGPDDPTEAPLFEIPKNVHDHIERMQFTMPAKAAGSENQTIYVYGVMGHEHLAGIDVKVDLERGADSQCLLQDKWDFHWQRMYTYAAPVEKLPTLEPGDKIKLRCTYDNSMSNRRLGTELKERGLSPIDIHLGEQTLDEMCLVIPQLLVKAPQ
jgi:Copper type II ascorbate-dependent monooxygenase, C-terminal domain